MTMLTRSNQATEQLMQAISGWVRDLGFADFGVSGIDLGAYQKAREAWLKNMYHGGMSWLEENETLRLKPEQLVDGTVRILSVRMNYLPENTDQINNIKASNQAYVARYALGRDYHKLMRKRLAKLGKQIEMFTTENNIFPNPHTRAFVDSAPVLEREIAQKAGLGWIGKHTLVLNKDEGSWFFLGELFTNIPLPITETSHTNECGDCQACLQICPTDAFPEPYVLDASRCISYLTIEHEGAIPEDLREPIGNRIFGCDDCQIICPWNKEAPYTQEQDFRPRHSLSSIDLLALFEWNEETFLKNTEGSAIRRTGYENWQRNLSVALGNAEKDIRIIEALERKRNEVSAMVAEHIDWAIERQRSTRRRKRKIKRSTTSK